jgi:hypothetical protein
MQEIICTRRLRSIQNNTKEVDKSFRRYTRAFFELNNTAPQLAGLLQQSIGPLKTPHAESVLPVLLVCLFSPSFVRVLTRLFDYACGPG